MRFWQLWLQFVVLLSSLTLTNAFGDPFSFFFQGGGNAQERQEPDLNNPNSKVILNYYSLTQRQNSSSSLKMYLIR